MRLVYVIGLFPKTSETFILGEILELERQGDQVQVCSLRPPRHNGPLHPGAQQLVDRTVYVADGAGGAVVMLLAALRLLLTRPARTAAAAGWSIRWAWRSRSAAELVRFGQACVLAGRLPDGDHIHAHFAHGPASAALLLSRLTGMPFSFTGHAREIFERFRDPVLAAKAAEARLVVAISEHGRQRITEAVRPADRHKVVLVRNGIDLGCFAPAPARGGAGPVRIVSVARPVPMKGLDTLVDACGVLRDRGIEVCCEIVGEGPLRPALIEQVGRLRLGDRVALPGAASREQVLATLQRSGIFALPSLPDPSGDMDGLPVSVVEAMAVGLPVVSTPVTGIPEVVVDGETGLLVPPDDPALLADALQRLVVDEELRRRLGAAARRHASGYDRTAWVARLRRLFAEGPPDDRPVPSPNSGADGTPVVSVIMTVYNGLPHVRDAVESVLAQDHADFELVVVDDGSTDETVAALAAYDDPRLRVIRRPHLGRVAALNTAVTAARGRYLANLDADDIALPGRLARSVGYLDLHPEVGAVGSAVQPYVGAAGVRHLPRSDRALRWSMLLRNPMFHSSVTYRAAVVRELGGFDPAYSQMCDDADMLLRIARRYRLANLPVPLSARRLHAGQHFATQPGRDRARLHASCRRRAARELPFAAALRPAAMLVATAAATRSWLVLGVLGRNGRLDHRALTGGG